MPGGYRIGGRGRCGETTKKKAKEFLLPLFLRAENETRTRDLRITNASLYQLSYFGNR